jgi:hypothetical protein
VSRPVLRRAKTGNSLRLSDFREECNCLVQGSDYRDQYRAQIRIKKFYTVRIQDLTDDIHKLQLELNALSNPKVSISTASHNLTDNIVEDINNIQPVINSPRLCTIL